MCLYSIVARHSTNKVRHDVLTRVYGAVVNKIAVSDGGNGQISARLLLTCGNFANDENCDTYLSL